MLGVRKATISLQFTGVIPGSAFKKKGVQRLLDCVVNYLPSPIDVPPMKGQDSDGNEVTVTVDDNAKLAGLAFKLWTDPFVGKLVFYRVYTGTLQKGTSLYKNTSRTKALASIRTYLNYVRLSPFLGRLPSQTQGPHVLSVPCKPNFGRIQYKYDIPAP